MRREQLDEYTRLGRWVRGSMYLRKSRANDLAYCTNHFLTG